MEEYGTDSHMGNLKRKVFRATSMEEWMVMVLSLGVNVLAQDWYAFARILGSLCLLFSDGRRWPRRLLRHGSLPPISPKN